MADLVGPNFLSDRFTIFYCVSTSSHYRYRCHWERNQILGVCVGPNNRSVWVQSFSQLCSPPSSAQLLVISSGFFFLLRCLSLFCVTDANHRFFFCFLFMHPVTLLFRDTDFMDHFAVVSVLLLTRKRVTVNVTVMLWQLYRKSCVSVFSSVCVQMLWLLCHLDYGNLAALHRKTSISRRKGTVCWCAL